MFDRLIDILRDCFEFFVPCVVVDQFERGVLLRFGVFKRKVGPGFKFIWPFKIDQVLTDNIVPRLKALYTQNLTTADGKNIVIGAVVTAEIEDIEKAILEVEGVDDALVDSCMGVVGRMVAESTWDQVRDEGFANKVAIVCRRNAKQWGVNVIRVQFADLALCRVYRLHSDKN